MKYTFIKVSTFALLSLANLANAEDFYQKTKGYRVEPEPDPPSYVRNLSKTQFEQFRDIEWLDVGLDFRTRYEYRENDYRPWTDTSSGKSVTKYRDAPNDVWLLRTRAYLGVKDILDPLRFAVEFQDSRSYGDRYETSTNDVNEFELIQGYAELYFDNALGNNRPINIRAGRQSFELLDKRLIANNQFRNTSNNFEGFRMRFGKQQNNWDLDTFGMQPIEKLKYDFDRPDEHTWIYGGVLSIRQWSEFATIQPYLIGRKTNGDLKNNIADMDIYSPGLRVYGLVGDSGFDYDTDLTKQFGRYGSISAGKQKMLQQDALAYSLELGYTFDHEWKPRTSIYYGYGSGDKNGKDSINQHMDTFYGFNQPWSRNDYFSWENLHAPKARVEFTPYKDVRIDTGYNAYWLASATDAWKRAGLSDPTGKSGSFLGHEFDARVRHQLNPYVDWSLSYSRFEPGDFTTAVAKNAGPFTSEATNFFYFEVSVNAFGDGKPKYK
ncbi:MAG: alginate export family protein [Methylococcales bacterium]|nr:alginate export family protein [Methylococcales bacterium]